MKEKLYPCEEAVPVEHEPRHYLVITNEFVRGFAVEIAPHDHTLCHYHEHEYLVYVAGDAQIVSAPLEGEPRMHTYSDSHCELSPPGLVHVVKNLGDTSFRNLFVELLPGIHGVQRGRDPRELCQDVKIAQRFNQPQIAVFLLELRSGSGAEIFGPAIVASPYEYEVELTALGEEDRKLTNFRDLFWLGPSKAATLRNRGNHVAKVVSITLGQA